MNRVVITGVAGFIGSRLAAWIREHYPACKIVGIDNLAGGFIDNVPAGVQFVNLDLADRFANPVFLVDQDTDAVFHCAAYASETQSAYLRRHTIRNVWEATANLVTACIQSKPGRLVFLSSAAVYGNAPAPYTEADNPEPVDPYGIAKLAAERDIEIAAHQHGLKYSILRLHNVFGPGQNIWDPTRNVFGVWMRAALEGRPIVVFGDGLQSRQFTFIDDLVKPIWTAGHLPAAAGRTLNVGTNNPTSLSAAATECARITGQFKIRHEPARHEIAHALCTNDRGNQLLEFDDSASLPADLFKMWQWAQDAWEKYPERRCFRGPAAELNLSGTPAA